MHSLSLLIMIPYCFNFSASILNLLMSKSLQFSMNVLGMNTGSHFLAFFLLAGGSTPSFTRNSVARAYRRMLVRSSHERLITRVHFSSSLLRPRRTDSFDYAETASNCSSSAGSSTNSLSSSPNKSSSDIDESRCKYSIEQY